MTLTYDLVTSKWIPGSHTTRATFRPMLDFIRLFVSVSDRGTGRRQTPTPMRTPTDIAIDQS